MLVQKHLAVLPFTAWGQAAGSLCRDAGLLVQVLGPEAAGALLPRDFRPQRGIIPRAQLRCGGGEQQTKESLQRAELERGARN